MDSHNLHIDPALLEVLLVVGLVLAAGMLMQILRQPMILGYLLAGLLIGPPGAGLVHDAEVITRMGSLGVVLLLFVVGTEINLPRFRASAKVGAAVSVGQLAVAIAASFGIGAALDWHWQRSLVVGFVLSLASTAVVVRKLRASGQLNSPIGTDLVAVLLAEDMLLVPMLIVIGIIAGGNVSPWQLATQVGAAVAIALYLRWLSRHEGFSLPLSRLAARDHELQVFTAIGLCLSFAVATAVAGLSAPLGAFLAGLTVGQARETHWVARAMQPFQVVFLALFFVSVGMAIDTWFFLAHLPTIAALGATIMIGLTVSRAVLFRLVGRPWGDAFRRSFALAQVGEFGFLITAVAFHAGVLVEYGQQLLLATITATIILSPLWVTAAGLARRPAGARMPAHPLRRRDDPLHGATHSSRDRPDTESNVDADHAA